MHLSEFRKAVEAQTVEVGPDKGAVHLFFVKMRLKYIRRNFPRSGNSLPDSSFERDLSDGFCFAFSVSLSVCVCCVRVSPQPHCIQSGIAKQ